MRSKYIIALLCLCIVLATGITYIHKDHVNVIKNPPASLAQWYKPENKRQVWLHNMFKLRREMQAVRFYADNNETEHLQKWAALLNDHYLKIGEMVPEWNKKLDLTAIANLNESINDNRPVDVSHALDDLDKSCKSCHTDFRAITAILYRAPDFSAIEITPSVSYVEHMEDLIKQINQIKIASEDGVRDIALSSLLDLEKGMDTLGKTCSNCHEKDQRVYPDDAMRKTMTRLEESLRTGTSKEQGEELGTLAVSACARCHGTHRLAYDTRKVFSDGTDWLQLIKH